MFSTVLNQMIFLFAFIVIGFLLAKGKFLPHNSASVLSKLENYLFMPALVLNTFIANCTPQNLASSWKLLLLSLALIGVLLPLSLLCAKLVFKEKYLQKISLYGLEFANFGFMGNAVMSAVFPEIFMDYLLFSMPIWAAIYLWGAPVLLISSSGENGEKTTGLVQRLKSFLNPMIIATLVGIVLGLTQLYIPKSITSVLKVSGDCMSPIAMLLTGITIGNTDVLALLKKWRVYVLSLMKVLLYPLLFILIFAFIPQNSLITPVFLKCAACFTAMPMGLNTIVIPAAYGKDTTDAAGMALLSHLLSVGTIPFMFYLLEVFVL